MNVFELDADLVGRYEALAGSFNTICADDISTQIDVIYRNGKFWPEPLIGLHLQLEQRTRRLVLAADDELTAQGLRPRLEGYQ